MSDASLSGIVVLFDPIAQDGDKAGSLKRLIIEELT
jgi:hypothetical protein